MNFFNNSIHCTDKLWTTYSTKVKLLYLSRHHTKSRRINMYVTWNLDVHPIQICLLFIGFITFVQDWSLKLYSTSHRHSICHPIPLLPHILGIKYLPPTPAFKHVRTYATIKRAGEYISKWCGKLVQTTCRLDYDYKKSLHPITLNTALLSPTQS